MLEPDWVAANVDSFDLFHFQFGYDGRHPEQLRELASALRRQGKPVVYTVHDLRNPNHDSHSLHDEQLAVVVGTADTLLTLTDCAAELIAQRFGRRAEVVPHPHIVPLELLAGRYAAPRRRGRTPRVGVHLKSLRPNMIGVPLLEALAPEGTVPASGPLRVDVHEEIWDPAAPAFRGDLRCTLEHLERTGAVDLRRHDYFSDIELYDYLRSLDVAILPYRFGTHSGWLEACRDLGTAVVAPDCGCYSGQGRVFSFHSDEDGFDPESLRAAVAAAVRAVEAGEVQPLGAGFRRRQRLEIAAAHRRVYEGLLDIPDQGRATGPPSGKDRDAAGAFGP